MNYNTVILGAGAAGLMCAIEAVRLRRLVVGLVGHGSVRTLCLSGNPAKFELHPVAHTV